MIYQSNIITLMRGGLSSYEMRVLVAIVGELQMPYLKSMRLNESLRPDEYAAAALKSLDLSLRITPICNGHAEYVMAAIKGLMSRPMEYYNPRNKSWIASPIIVGAHHVSGATVVLVRVARWFAESLYDVSCGYTKYDADIIARIKSPYAMRLYMMVNTLRQPITYGVDNLRALFGVEGKYPRVPDFCKRVLEPSRKELSALGVNHFSWEILRTGQTPTAIRFAPVKSTAWIGQQTSLPADACTAQYRTLVLELTKVYGFAYREVLPHKAVLTRFAAIPGCLAMLNDIDRRARRNDKSKGYYIAAIRSIVNEYSESGMERAARKLTAAATATATEGGQS